MEIYAHRYIDIWIYTYIMNIFTWDLPVNLFTAVTPVGNLRILCSFWLSVFCNFTLFWFGAKIFNSFGKNKAFGYMKVWELFWESISFPIHGLKLVPPQGPFLKKAQGSVTPTWKCSALRGQRQGSAVPTGSPPVEQWSPTWLHMGSTPQTLKSRCLDPISELRLDGVGVRLGLGTSRSSLLSLEELRLGTIEVVLRWHQLTVPCRRTLQGT